MAKRQLVQLDMMEDLIKPSILSELIIVTKLKITAQAAKTIIEKHIMDYFRSNKESLEKLISLYTTSKYLDYQILLEKIVVEIRSKYNEVYVNS